MIVSLREKAHEIKDNELNQLFKNVDWKDDDRQQVERSVELIVNKILHTPISSLRKGLEEEEHDHKRKNLMDLFKDFFNI